MIEDMINYFKEDVQHFQKVLRKIICPYITLSGQS